MSIREAASREGHRLGRCSLLGVGRCTGESYTGQNGKSLFIGYRVNLAAFGKERASFLVFLRTSRSSSAQPSLRPGGSDLSQFRTNNNGTRLSACGCPSARDGYFLPTLDLKLAEARTFLLSVRPWRSHPANRTTRVVSNHPKRYDEPSLRH